MRANYPKGLGGPQNMNGMMKQVQKMQVREHRQEL